MVIVTKFRGCLVAENFSNPFHWARWRRLAKETEAKDHVLVVFELPSTYGYPDTKLISQIQNLITNYNPSHYEVESEH